MDIFYTKLMRTFADTEVVPAIERCIESTIHEIAQPNEVLYLGALAKQQND